MNTAEMLKAQLKSLEKIAEETNKINTIFEQNIENAIFNAPDKDKNEIIELQKVCRDAIEMSKKGSFDGFRNINKMIQDASKNC